MSSTTNVLIYIPRILGNIRKKTIVDTFYELNIGYTKKIDMFHRRNRFNHEYYFSFITLQLFKTDAAVAFYNKLIKSGKLNLIYDEESGNYWEVKIYVPRNERANMHNHNAVDISSELPNEEVESVKSMSIIENINDIIQPSINAIWSVWSEFPNIFQYNDPFTEQDKLELINDYDELSRIISYGNTVENV